MHVGIPNFPTSKDRITYLIAEYKYILAVFSGAAVVGAIQFGVVKLPDWLAATITAAIVLGVLGTPIVMRIVSWLYDPHMVEVYHVNAVTDDVKKWLVPPQVWREKTVDGPDPYPINGGQSWAVREFDWRDDVGELEVRGVWFEAVQDTQLITSKAQMEDIHGILIDKFLQLARLHGRVSRMGAEVQEATVQEMATTAEEVTMLDEDAVRDAFEDAKSSAEDSGEDDLPTVSAEDLPDHETPDPQNHPAHDVNGDETTE